MVDLDLGVGSAIDVVAAIKTSRPTTYCVIAATFQDQQHIFSALQVGADGCLLKSESHVRLIQRLVGITNNDPPLLPDIARKLLGHFAACPSEQSADLTPHETEILILIGKRLSRPEVARQFAPLVKAVRS